MKRFFILTFLLLLISGKSIGQSAFADSLLRASLARIEKIPEYVCDIRILVDVERINIKERTGKVYFYPPDSINYDIKGFAFLPTRLQLAIKFSNRR
jgi:hypothetical protein